MLTIRKDQMAAFSDHLREDYIKRTLKNLAQLFPDDAALKDESATRALIEYAIGRAEVYRITAAREVSLFIFLVKDLGADFEKRTEHRWMEEVLLDEELDEGEKMDVIYTRLEVAAGRSK